MKTDITGGVIWKQLLSLFFPILLGTFFQQLYNTADAIIVGRFLGKEALAAVGGGTGTLINLLVGFFVGVSSGAAVIISQFYGAGKHRETRSAVHTAFAVAVCSGIIITVVGYVFSPAALAFMNTPQEIFPHALVYIRIYFIGSIPLTAYNMGAGIFRAIGDSRRPMYFLIVSTAANIVFDLLFIGVFGWGIAGAAWATVLSQCASMLMVTFSLSKTRKSYRLYITHIRFTFSILKAMLRIGFPTGIQSILYTVSNILIQTSINALGTNTAAAWAAYGKIDRLYWMTVSAFGIAMTTFAGQNYGAGNYERIKTGSRQCMAMAGAASVLLAVFFRVCGKHLYLLFTSDTAVIAQGLAVLRFLAPTFISFVPIEIYAGTIRGAGKSLIPTLISASGICLLRVVWIAIAVPIKPGLLTVAASYPITWIITSLMFTIYYRSNKWLVHGTHRAVTQGAASV